MIHYDYKSWSKDKLLSQLNEDLNDKYGNKIIEFNKAELKAGANGYVELDLRDFTENEKEILFADVLKGLYFFFHIFTDTRSFNMGGFNSLKKAINGNNSIFLYTRGIKNINEQVRIKINKQLGKEF